MGAREAPCKRRIIRTIVPPVPPPAEEHCEPRAGQGTGGAYRFA
jgi:hypothetical protein